MGKIGQKIGNIKWWEYIIYVFILGIILFFTYKIFPTEFTVYYSDRYELSGNIVYIYADSGKGWNDTEGFSSIINQNNKCTIFIPTYDENIGVRFDPIAATDTLYIEKIEIGKYGITTNTWKGEALTQIFKSSINITSIEYVNGVTKIVPLNSDPEIFMSDIFVQEITKVMGMDNILIKGVLVCILFLGIILRVYFVDIYKFIFPKCISTNAAPSELINVAKMGRNELVDILRGIAVVTVVAGHAFQRGYGNGCEALIWMRIIRAYQMPLFMLLAGYTLCLADRKYGDEKYKKRLKTKILTLIYPTIIWNYLIWIVRDFWFVGIKPFISFPDSLMEYTKVLLKYPTYVVWFLWVVFFLTVLIWIGKKVCGTNWLIWIFFIQIIINTVPGSYWGLDKIKLYLPYFVGGYLLAEFPNYLRKYYLHITILSGIMLFIPRIIEAYTTIFTGIKNLGLTMFSICIIYIIAQWICKFSWRKVFIFFGKYSLQIYLCQMLCLNIGIGEGYIRVLSIFITALFIASCLSVCTTKLKFANALLYGKFK